MLETLKKIVFFIPVWIYNMVISRVLTVFAHQFMMDELEGELKGKKNLRILDIGVGTGMPLFKIYRRFGEGASVLGVDIDQNYVKAAQQLFREEKNVEIRYQDFYTLDAARDGQFDIVFFSFSFMLMPNPAKALELAQRLLKKDGKLLFLLTLNKKKAPLAEKLKPLIKYLTTIDFGNVVYENQFTQLIEAAKKIKLCKNVRVVHPFNPLLRLFRISYIEAEHA